MARFPDEASPNLDPIAVLVDADIRRIIARYGEDAVKLAIDRQRRRSPGRPAERDWPISEFLRSDALHWLDQGELPRRSARSIARAFATKYPGHSEQSTVRRVMEKLSGRVAYFTLVDAAWFSRDHYPHAAHLRTLKELSKQHILADLWGEYLGHAEARLSLYQKAFGAPPISMTMNEIEMRPSANSPADAPTRQLANVFEGLRK